MIDFGLAGKRAIISGAGYIPGRAGHGRHSALLLAEAGATVACIDIDQGRARDIVAEIQSQGGKAFSVLADMTKPDEVNRAVSDVVRELGGIDVCVDIIGKATWNAVEEFTDEQWDQAILNNLSQAFYLFRAVSRQMIAQQTGGSMVALASVDGIAASGFHVAYGAAKAGLISMAKTMADELGRFGIRVNTVAPGNVAAGNEDQNEDHWAVDTLNPLLAPRGSDVGKAVLFLSSDLAARITGQNLVVDGGASIKSLWGITPEVLPLFKDF
jgi:3-oxoacyl-[acyl-carrier protein] reductase